MPLHEQECTFNRLYDETWEKKDGSGQGHNYICVVDIVNSFEKAGEVVSKPTVHPFRVYGKSLEVAQTLKPGDKIKVKYELRGREYNGKVFGESQGVFIERLEKEIEF